MVQTGRDPADLPEIVRAYIDSVIRKMRYRRKVRREVRQELIDHFTDALSDCKSEQERQERAERLIADFGDAKLLAVLIRRGKKRCRPAWAKALIRTGQAMLGLILLFCLYTAWFLTGRPTVRVDYVAQLNRMVRPAVPQEQNAWPYYARAIELYVEPGKDLERIASLTCRHDEQRKTFADLTESERQALERWTKQNGPAWEQFVAASKRPFCWLKYRTLDEQLGMFGVLLPHLAPLRGVSRVGIWRARIAASRGDPYQALQDCLTVARAARHWQGKDRILIEQRVAIAMATGAYQEMRHIVKGNRVSSRRLADLQAALGAIYPEGYPFIDLEVERLGFLDTVQRLFTDGGPGGGHLIPQEYGRLQVTLSPPVFRSVPFWTATGMLHAGRDETLAVADRIYEYAARWAKMSPYERHITGGASPRELIEALSPTRFFVVRGILPSRALDEAAKRMFQGKAEYEATLTILALRRWRIEKGRYPDGLNELVAAGYLKRLPADPYSDGPLKYERRGEDFVLYSLGADFDDDGGVRDPDDPWGPGEKGGDRVFWPLPEDSRRSSADPRNH